MRGDVACRTTVTHNEDSLTWKGVGGDFQNFCFFISPLNAPLLLLEMLLYMCVFSHVAHPNVHSNKCHGKSSAHCKLSWLSL